MENPHATEISAAKTFNGLSKSRYWGILLLILTGGLIWNYFFPRPPAPFLKPFKVERKFVIMGTFANTVIYGRPELAEPAAAAVRAVFTRIETTCNIFDPASEISRLNATASATAFKCSPLLWNMFNSARRAYYLSDGAFDVTARPLMALWGFYQKRGDSLPTAAEIREARNRVGLSKVSFDDKNHTVKFTVPGMSVDFGGIAKGIAVQIAVRKIKAAGIRQAVIDLGGNMYCLGRPPAPKQFYTIGIRNPLDKNAVWATTALRDEAVATSGNYERYLTINGHHYTHIMNPATGQPVEDMLSVTVVTPDAGNADFLSTAVFIGGTGLAEKICRANPDTGIFIIRRKPDDKSGIETVKIGRFRDFKSRSAGK
ncbi:MAG: FAD:protein FMN transferase [Victivallaceae bacterium]|nr:FAD:protein FMN transferase [Victivallaceae bacterium]